jgi:hypothetical protein
MKFLQKIAEAFSGSPTQDAAARTRALSRLGPPRQRYDNAMPA